MHNLSFLIYSHDMITPTLQKNTITETIIYIYLISNILSYTEVYTKWIELYVIYTGVYIYVFFSYSYVI